MYQSQLWLLFADSGHKVTEQILHWRVWVRCQWQLRWLAVSLNLDGPTKKSCNASPQQFSRHWWWNRWSKYGAVDRRRNEHHEQYDKCELMHFYYFENSLFQALHQWGRSKKQAGNELDQRWAGSGREKEKADPACRSPTFSIVPTDWEPARTSYFEMEGLFLTYSTMKSVSDKHPLYVALTIFLFLNLSSFDYMVFTLCFVSILFFRLRLNTHIFFTHFS